MADHVRGFAEVWLKTKHTTLWGRAFDLSRDVDAAVDWFLAEVEEFLDFAERRIEAGEQGAARRAATLPRHSFDVV